MPRDFSRPRADAGRAVRARPRSATELLTRAVRRRRGRDPAALGADRRACLPGHGHRERRPRRPRRPAQGRGPRPERDGARGRRHAAAARDVGRARREPRRSRRARRRRSPTLVRRQAVPLGPGAKRALVVLAAMVVLLATGAVPPAVAGLLAAGAIVLARRAHDRAGLPRHLLDDGDPRRRDDPALDGDDRDAARPSSSPTASCESSATPGRYALLLGLFVLTAVLGQLISNMATALIVIPIAVSAAADIERLGEAGADVRRPSPRRPRSSPRSRRRRT